MILLAILQLLQDQGFGTIGTDLFFEDVPIVNSKPTDGIWIIGRGASVSRTDCEIQNFDIYARYTNKLTGLIKLDNILHYLVDAYDTVCELSATNKGVIYQFNNVRITPTTSTSNDGSDENGKLVRVISGEVKYNKEN